MRTPTAEYSTKRQNDMAAFLDSVMPRIAAEKGNTHAILDSVRNEGGVKVPEQLDRVLGKVTEGDAGRILDSIQRGVEVYTHEHGVAPTADVLDAAVQQGYSALHGIDTTGRVLDDVATSAHHAQMSLQPNRAVLAILSAIAEAIPFAGYLPVDIASNQAKLAILSHNADSAYGDYAAGASMDGVNIGGVYTSAARSAKFDVTGTAPFASKFTSTNLANDAGFCDTGGTGVAVMRGRTKIFVDGIPVAADVATGSGSTSAISGTTVIGATTYTVAGTVTLATGVLSLTTFTASPSLPSGIVVYATGVIDYEASPALIPSVGIKAETYDLYANAWRVKTGISIDASTQLRNELGVDGKTEALGAIRTQMAMERHYRALAMAYHIGRNNVVSYDFDWSNQKAQKNRAQVLQDFASVLSNADQTMANQTMDHGITHIYAPAYFCALCMGLPSELFKPSGLTARPGIYRVGRLFDKYEIYYSPKAGVVQNAGLTTSTLIAVGRSTQVARNPIILGDAVSPTFLPLAMNSDMVDASAVYARDFTEVNPHQPSALGCARINITNLS